MRVLEPCDQLSLARSDDVPVVNRVIQCYQSGLPEHGEKRQKDATNTCSSRLSDHPTALKRNTKTGMCVVVNLIESGLVISYLVGNKS